MNISFTQTIKLNESELTEFLIKNLAKELNLDPTTIKSVRFKYGTRTEGYGPMEHDASYFDGVEIEVKK